MDEHDVYTSSLEISTRLYHLGSTPQTPPPSFPPGLRTWGTQDCLQQGKRTFTATNVEDELGCWEGGRGRKEGGKEGGDICTGNKNKRNMTSLLSLEPFPTLTSLSLPSSFPPSLSPSLPSSAYTYL